MTLLCALFVKHFKPVVEAGHIYVAMPPLYRIDVGKEVFYALDEDEKNGVIDRIAAEKKPGKVRDMARFVSEFLGQTLRTCSTFFPS